MAAQTTYRIVDGGELYETDPNSNSEVVKHGRYAVDKDKVPYYPKDENNNEFMDETLGLIERNGRYVYPRTAADGKPNYRKDKTLPAKQIYEKINNVWIIGTGLDGNQYYATDETGNEYYPEDNTPARKANGTIFYAKKTNQDTIFPTSNGNEFYLTPIDPSRPETIPNKYAKEGGANEIYPKKIVDGDLKADFILNNAYADRGGVKYYPKDAYNNEYYLPPKDSAGAARLAATVVLVTYAVTNDGKVILPTEGATHKVVANKLPAVTDANVVGKLIRERSIASSDYLTNVDATAKPTWKPMQYRYVDLKTNIIKTVTPAGAAVRPGPKPVRPFFKTWYFWVLVIVSLIVKVFGIWWFFFRNTSRPAYSSI